MSGGTRKIISQVCFHVVAVTFVAFIEIVKDVFNDPKTCMDNEIY